MKTKLDLEGRNIEIGLMTIMFHIDTNVSKELCKYFPLKMYIYA